MAKKTCSIADTCSKSWFRRSIGFRSLVLTHRRYTKLNADAYCPPGTRFVFHLDSDVVLTRTLAVRDVFWKGKAMLQYAPYDSLAPGDAQWQLGTSAAINADVKMEFSRSNSHVYPISVFPRIRAFLEKTHGKPLARFLNTKHGRYHGPETKHEDLFSDFNASGCRSDQLPRFLDFANSVPI